MRPRARREGRRPRLRSPRRRSCGWRSRPGYGSPIPLYLSHPVAFEHETGAHPENSGRLAALEARLEEAGWPGLERAEAPAASRQQLERVHAAEHIDAIEALCAAGGGELDPETLASPRSFEAALRAAGAATAAVDSLLAGAHETAFCAMRPPGHHAERARAMGFCLFNNVAVAAAHALAAGGCERILVLDWDVHHGNGTEAIFAASPEVLFVSIHESPLYPGTGPAGYVGEGEGEGFTVNLPVGPGTGGDEFLALVEHLVAPLARAYEPNLIALSAGFDAHRADPLSTCRLEVDDFGALGARIGAVAAELGLPVLACLEGGYAPAALADSVLATLEGLDGTREPVPAPTAPAEPHLARVRERWAI